MGAVLFDQPWELVIVDNGSSDGTSEVVAAFSPPAGCKLVYVREETRGLSHARNRGVRESSAPILVFTDDDCYVEQDYLQEWARAFRDAVVGFGGGRVLLHDPDAPRMTVQDKAVPASIEPMTFLRAGALHGANMAFRRVVFERVGVFDPFLGAGSATNAGEDCDLLTRASLAGFLGVYDPGPTVRHDHGRVSEGDLAAIEHAYDLGRGAYFGKHVASLATLGPAMGCWYRSSRSCARSLAGMKRLARELWGACTYWYIRLTSRNGRSTGGASVKEGGR
jgi:GT2 family glycosyltransferase